MNSIYDIKEDERNYESASRNIDIKMIWLVKSSAFSFDRYEESLDQKYL